MTCEIWEERVALFAGGDLGAGEAAAVERHLNHCAACSAMAAELRGELEELRQAHTQPLAAGDYAIVRGRVLAELERAPRRHAVWPWALAAALAAAGAVVSVVVTTRTIDVPAPELSRMLALAPMVKHMVPRERASNRPFSNRERRGWQAKAPAPPAGGKVGQTPGLRVRSGFSSVSPQTEPAGLPPPVEDSPVRMVQLATDDPNVVIYWQLEETGEEQ